MTTATIQKNYKKLEERVRNLEAVITVVLQDETIPAYGKKLLRISHKLDQGLGKRIPSPRDLRKYLRSL